MVYPFHTYNRGGGLMFSRVFTRPRLHLIRFHDVLAPNAKLRAQVVPQEPEPPEQAAPPAEC